MTEFTCGHCMYLAYVLHKKFGFPISGLLVDEDMDGEADDMVHVWVDLPNGQVADAYGIADADEFLRTWEEKAEVYGDYEYQYNISPDWLLQILRNQGAYKDIKTHQGVLKQAYRAVVSMLEPEFRDEGIIESMAPDEALQIFKKYGVDARGMDKAALRKARGHITKKGELHPDKGGSHDLMQELNQAVDALVAQPQKRPQKPQAGFQDFGDYMKGQGKAPPKKGGFEPFQGVKVYRDVANFRPGQVWKA